jgi:hypothetical protein
MAVKPSTASIGATGRAAGFMLQAAAASVFGWLAFIGAFPLLCLLLPALLAVVLEREPGRPLTRTLLLFGIAGAWDPIAAFWQARSVNDVDWSAILGGRPLALAWLAQAAGCLLAEGAGLGFVLLADRESERIKAACQAEIAALRTEWSLTETEGGVR